MCLNNIMMLHLNKDRTDALSLIDVANDFIDGRSTVCPYWVIPRKLIWKSSSSRVKQSPLKFYFTVLLYFFQLFHISVILLSYKTYIKSFLEKKDYVVEI